MTLRGNLLHDNAARLHNGAMIHGTIIPTDGLSTGAVNGDVRGQSVFVRPVGIIGPFVAQKGIITLQIPHPVGHHARSGLQFHALGPHHIQKNHIRGFPLPNKPGPRQQRSLFPLPTESNK